MYSHFIGFIGSFPSRVASRLFRLIYSKAPYCGMSIGSQFVPFVLPISESASGAVPYKHIVIGFSWEEAYIVSLSNRERLPIDILSNVRRRVLRNSTSSEPRCSWSRVPVVDISSEWSNVKLSTPVWQEPHEPDILSSKRRLREQWGTMPRDDREQMIGERRGRNEMKG